MRIARHLYDAMIVHAQEEAPNECCGVVASLDDSVVAVHRAVNAEASPLRFRIDPMEQIQLHNKVEGAGFDLGAIYHSHTRTEPYPSQTDINLAFYPEALYVIVGVANEEADVRAYTIRDGQVTDAELIVE
jgi:[CysO sulfur-carrier protein]-S-L-cysteine hydrolase